MQKSIFVPTVALAALIASICQAAEKVGPLTEAMPEIPIRSPRIDYKVDLKTEPYFIRIPENYDGSKPFGLVVFIPAGGMMQTVPKGWDKVLDERKLLFICPQRATNTCEQPHRMGLAVVGALKMQELYKVDPKRVYVAGISGGARTASDLGFYQTDLFHATLQSCGSDFPRKVPQVVAVPLDRDKGGTYGVIETTQQEWKAAHEKVRFVIITGPGDFRHGNLLDIHSGGYLKEGFQVKLFDVPGMGHQTCDAATLTQALDFIEQGR